MIPRPAHTEAILALLRQFPVVAIIGARQVGKTTLAGLVAEEHGAEIHHFDLESPGALARLSEPELTLGSLKGLVVLDEIQRVPGLFEVLRVLADRPGSPARFLVLGSASGDLLKQSSESLAGRIAYHELHGLDLSETGKNSAEELWLRGGFPRSYLAPDDVASERWREEFIRTYLERDLPNLGLSFGATTLRRFWTMLAHNHGQLWNGSRLGSALGVSHTTTRRYLDVLSDTFMVRQLPPFVANIGKRQVKSPKVYLRDSGLLHSLLGIENHETLTGHPVVGASWEGFALEHVLRHIGASERQCFFWAVYSGAKVDLLIEKGGKRLGFEFKRTLTPRVTASMRSAAESLHLDRLTIVYPGSEEFELAGGVRVTGLARISKA